MDYGMRRGFALMRVRVCFVYYVERRLDLEAAVQDPGRRQLVLLNREEVERVRDRAQGNARRRRCRHMICREKRRRAATWSGIACVDDPSNRAPVSRNSIEDATRRSYTLSGATDPGTREINNLGHTGEVRILSGAPAIPHYRQ